MQDHDDKLAALERRVADLEAANAALVQRVAELEQVVAELRELHSVELAALRDERPDARAAVVAEQARDRERAAALTALRFAETPARTATTALRAVVDAKKHLWESDAAPVRRALPRLESAVTHVRQLMAGEPWPEAEERLQTRNMGEALLAEARAVLGQFDELLAEREAARRGR